MRVAFLGLGPMGWPMARNVLGAGFQLTVWNRTPGKAGELETLGAFIASSAAEAVENAELTIAMVKDGGAVAEILGEHGVAETLQPGSCFVDMSSIRPALAIKHDKLLREKGVGYLDAPVSGGTVGAANGTLAIMVGGEPSVLESCRPALTALGRPTLVGPAGAGQLTKLCNQIIVAIGIGAIAEAFTLARCGGAEPKKVHQALRGGFADSRILQEHGERMLARNFSPGGATRNQLKDLEAAMEVANELELDLPMLRLTRDLFAQLIEQTRDGGELDHSALLLDYERRNQAGP